MRYAHIRRAIAENAWAILPEKLAEIVALVGARAQGEEISAEVLAEFRAAARDRPKLRANGDIAILPVFGTISHRMGMMSEMSGGTSVEGLTRDFRALINDPSVAAIVLDVNSPGGTVSGIEELSAEIYKARGIKPISAVSNALCASAAYWLATAADELAVTPSGIVGSIGVFGTHEDWSSFYEQFGVNVTLISAGKYKTEGHPFGPLDDEARAAFQKRVDESYGMFTKAVARNRGVSVETVRNGFAEGRVVGARESVTLGMADRVATLDDVIATVGRRRTSVVEPAARAGGVRFISGVIPIVDGDGRIINQEALDAMAAEMSVEARRTYRADDPPMIEDQAEAVLMAVEAFVSRCGVLTARRVSDGRALGAARVDMFREHRDAYRALADALGDLVQEPIDQAAVRSLEFAFLAGQVRRLGVPV